MSTIINMIIERYTEHDWPLLGATWIVVCFNVCAWIGRKFNARPPAPVVLVQWVFTVGLVYLMIHPTPYDWAWLVPLACSPYHMLLNIRRKPKTDSRAAGSKPPGAGKKPPRRKGPSAADRAAVEKRRKEPAAGH